MIFPRDIILNHGVEVWMVKAHGLESQSVPTCSPLLGFLLFLYTCLTTSDSQYADATCWVWINIFRYWLIRPASRIGKLNSAWASPASNTYPNNKVCQPSGPPRWPKQRTNLVSTLDKLNHPTTHVALTRQNASLTTRSQPLSAVRLESNQNRSQKMTIHAVRVRNRSLRTLIISMTISDSWWTGHATNESECIPRFYLNVSPGTTIRHVGRVDRISAFHLNGFYALC